jgi:hypothetical protein
VFCASKPSGTNFCERGDKNGAQLLPLVPKAEFFFEKV